MNSCTSGSVQPLRPRGHSNARAIGMPTIFRNLIASFSRRTRTRLSSRAFSTRRGHASVVFTLMYCHADH
eukprot:14442444-Heterocapsa_arctica.AAC.1